MSQRTEGDLQFILPKKGSSTLSVHQEDSSDVTKTIDLLIEDFQEKLNDAVQRQILNEEFITSPRFPIGGYQYAVVSIFMPGNYPDRVFVYVWMEEMEMDDIKSILLTGHCGKLTFTLKSQFTKKKDGWFVKLGSIDELQEAMNTTGNHKLDLQVTVTASVTRDSDEDQWIIPR